MAYVYVSHPYIYVHEFKDDIQAGLVKRQGYIPKNHCANWNNANQKKFPT